MVRISIFRRAKRYVSGLLRYHTLSRSQIYGKRRLERERRDQEYATKLPESVRTNEGVKIFLNPTDKMISLAIAVSGTWEENLLELFKKSLKRSRLFVDVGANLGWYTLIAARAGVRVSAFEPEQRSFQLLKKSVETNGFIDRVTLFDVALAERHSVRRLSISSNNGGGSSIVREAGEQRQWVECVTIDSIFPSETIDLLKLDVEHAEPLVLMGAENLIASRRIIRMIIEWTPSAWVNHLSLMENLFRNYRVTSIDPWGTNEAGASVPTFRNLLMEDKASADCLYFELK